MHFLNSLYLFRYKTILIKKYYSKIWIFVFKNIRLDKIFNFNFKNIKPVNKKCSN